MFFKIIFLFLKNENKENREKAFGSQFFIILKNIENTKNNKSRKQEQVSKTILKNNFQKQ